ncbi:MAG TPA: hypothetical protein PKY82_02650 [Pyrinomonadaceae bacterium]|nr:hypothetical protein [Pyrinomonadaceae bacterium]
MFLNALIFISFAALTLIGYSSLSVADQSSQLVIQSKQGSQELKTTRLHIDGFMKSKSGAI